MKSAWVILRDEESRIITSAIDPGNSRPRDCRLHRRPSRRLLRGYETSIIGAVRDLLMFFPLMVLAIWLSRTKRFAGNWVSSPPRFFCLLSAC